MTARVGDDDVGAVEEDEGPDERLGLGLARVLHRGHDGVVGDGAGVGQLDLAVGPELDRVDGAVAPPPGVDPLAGRAAQSEQAVVLRGLDGPVGGIGYRVPVGDGGEVVHAFHRLARPGRCPRPRSRASRPERSRRCHRSARRGCLATGAPPGRPRPSPPASRRPPRAEAGWSPRRGGSGRRRRGAPADAARRGRGPRSTTRRCRPGPPRRSRASNSAPVAGSHSMGGTRTPSPLRMPRIGFSVRAVMNAPDHRAEGPLVRERDGAGDEAGHRSARPPIGPGGTKPAMCVSLVPDVTAAYLSCGSTTWSQTRRPGKANTDHAGACQAGVMRPRALDAAGGAAGSSPTRRHADGSNHLSGIRSRW